MLNVHCVGITANTHLNHLVYYHFLQGFDGVGHATGRACHMANNKPAAAVQMFLGDRT